jgi:sugar phosphate isomerase/epimerase
MSTRREFLQTSAAFLAVGCATNAVSGGVTAPPVRSRLGFSTLGTPGWDLSRIVDFAASNGFSAIELRGVGLEMDLAKVPEFSPARIAASKQLIADRGLSIVGLGASTNMHETDPTRRANGLAEARRFIDLAQGLGAPYVRVFGNKWVQGQAREETIAHIARGLHDLGEYAKERGVTVLLESHGDFVTSPDLEEILTKANSAGVALLWDAHHTFAFGKEAPEITVQRLGRWIRHTHLKDSVPAGNDRRYVMTGSGDVPIRKQVELLVKMGYKGYFNFEWEKKWHPEIENPEVAIPHFARMVGGMLKEFGA